jgi:hypothetical protein
VRVFDSKHIKTDLLIAFMGLIAGLFCGNVGLSDTVWAEQHQGELTASLDPSSVQVGDVTWLTLHYRLPEGGSLQDDPIIGGIEGITKLEQTVEPGQIRIKLFVDRLESWQSDTLTLSFEDKAGNIQTLKTDPVFLTVRSVLGEKPAEAQLRPIRDIFLTKSLWRSYWPWVAGLAGLVLMLSCAYLWYRQKRNRNIPTEMMEPPHVSARKALEALERRQFFEKGEVKAFYFTFSEIMRRYLESIRHFPAAEYTTEEISHQIRKEIDRKLLPLLRQADLVKFADTVPTPARKEEDVRSALSYIDETRPQSDDTANMEPQRRIIGVQP